MSNLCQIYMQFLVCTISLEPVSGFSSNLQRCIIGANFRADKVFLSLTSLSRFTSDLHDGWEIRVSIKRQFQFFMSCYEAEMLLLRFLQHLPYSCIEMRLWVFMYEIRYHCACQNSTNSHSFLFQFVNILFMSVVYTGPRLPV